MNLMIIERQQQLRLGVKYYNNILTSEIGNGIGNTAPKKLAFHRSQENLEIVMIIVSNI